MTPRFNTYDSSRIKRKRGLIQAGLGNKNLEENIATVRDMEVTSVKTGCHDIDFSVCLCAYFYIHVPALTYNDIFLPVQHFDIATVGFCST